jgi:hypothetical protein
MKGPMTTQTLRGLNGNDPLHWRGDRTNFLHFNGAFASLLGGAPLAPEDMAAFRAFVNTIVFQPNPNQTLERALPDTLAGGNPSAGESFFRFTPVMSPGIVCADCHAGPAGSGPEIVDAAHLQQAQSLKAPQLRSVYQKLSFNASPGSVNVSGFGLTHDGSDGGLLAHFSINRFFPVLRTSETRKSDLAAFLMCFDTGTAPAVGYTRTINALNVNSPAVSNDWSVLEGRPPSDSELIVKGTIDGSPRGLRFIPSTQLYETDKAGVGPFTRDQLAAKILAGDTLTFMGVPSGMGKRLGTDRDDDGVSDGDEPVPPLTIARSAGSLTLSWPADAGVVLEAATSLFPPDWRPETRIQNVISNQFSLPVPTTAEGRFFRLRRL